MDDETTGRLPDDEELTRVTPPAGDEPAKAPPPDEDRTRVMPPAGEGETQVMPGEDTGATRVMPTAGGAAPPPPPQPTLVMSRGYQPSDGRGVPWWVWLLVVLAIVAAAAAVWFFLLRPSSEPATTGGEVFVGSWSPQDGSGGGLVIKKSGEEFTVTEYDRQLQPAGTTNATLNGDQLELTVKASAVGLTDVTGTIDGVLTHDSADDTLTLQFNAGSLQLNPIVYVRVDVLLPGTPAASPTPTVPSSPTTSPTASPTTTASPSPSGSPTADQQTQANIAKLQVGIVAWAADNNNLYPAPQDVVDGGGLSQYVSPWPTNPFTSQTMAPGTSPGSYVYEQLAGGQSYRITGYLSNGLTYTVP